MPYIVDVPALLTVLADKGKGDESSVHWAARILVENADPRALAIVDRCMAIKSQTPRIAPVKLRQLWQTTRNATARAIVEACHDLPGDQPDTAMEDRQHAQQAADRRRQAPRNDRRKVDPTARRTHQERATIQRANEIPGAVAAYDADQAQAAADSLNPLAQLMLMGASKSTAPGYDRDHDEDAVDPMYGFPCVYCWIQRTPSDHDGRKWDDGLCGECRSLDRPGIAPELAEADARMEAICTFRPVGLMPAIGRDGSRAAAIAARCVHIISRTGNAAVRILQNEWKRAHRDEDRDVIAQWGTARKAATRHIEFHGHPVAINTPVSTPRCTECGEPAASRGLCGTCRALNIETHTAPITAAG